MSCCFHHHDCSCRPSCPYPEWIHPLCCNPTHYCSAGYENGPTLVIHKIVLEPCGSQSCTPKTFTLRITGPVCGGNMVSLVANCPPTVVTIVNRKRLCRVCPRTYMCF